jgi:hypothetical protein
MVHSRIACSVSTEHTRTEYHSTINLGSVFFFNVSYMQMTEESDVFTCRKMRNGSIKNTAGSSLTVGPFFCKIEQREIKQGLR